MLQQRCLSAGPTLTGKQNKERTPIGHQSYGSDLHLESKQDLGQHLAAGGAHWFCDVESEYVLLQVTD